MNVVGQQGRNQTRGTRISTGYARKRSRIVAALWLLFLLVMGRNAWNSARNQSFPDRASGKQFMPADGVNQGGDKNARSVTVQPIGCVVDSAENGAPGEPGLAVSRRLLVATATAAAVGAVVTSAVFAEHLLSGQRTGPLGKAGALTQSLSTAGKAPTKTRGVTGPAATSSARRLAWAPVANASAYTVEISEGGGAELIYSATTRRAYVRVPDRWRRNGRTMTLSAGTYHWYVWPVFGSGAERHQGRKAIVASVLAIAP